MPETYVRVRWPDESVMRCYSPSLVIKKFFNAGQSYPLADFVKRSREGLTLASERVKEAFGHHCSIAKRQLAEIEETATQFETAPDASVTVEAFEDI